MSQINRWVKKNKHRVLFYSSMYGRIVDNNEAFYSWLVDNGYDEKLDIVFCLPNRAKGPELPGRHRTVGTVRGIFEYMRSGFVLFTYGGMRIVPSEDQVVVNLWHGMPLKRIGKLSNDAVIEAEDIADFSYTIATSRLFAPIMARVFGCREDQVIISGLPRNDYLCSNDCDLHRFAHFADSSRTILWMPTFRKSFDGRYDNSDIETSTGLPIATSVELLHRLDSWLGEKGGILFIKAHPYALAKSSGLQGEQFQNIVFVNDEMIRAEGLRLYEFVAAFDSLLTDYSSIYFDFLLLDRPIGFTLDDYESYQKMRGFIFPDAKDMMPGQHIYSFDELCSFVAAVCSGDDSYCEERGKTRDLIHEYKGYDCRRGLADRIGLLSVLESTNREEQK